MQNDSTPAETSTEVHTSPWRGTAPGSQRAKVIIIVVIVVVLLGLLYAAKSLLIAATVNGSPVTRLQVMRQLEKQAGATVLDGFINQKLIAREAKEKDITVNNEEVDAQIKTIEESLTAQNTTLDEALKTQKMTKAELIEQIIVQKQLEKLLAGKISVEESEIDAYIKDNKVTIPAGQEALYRSQVKDQITGQKMSEQAQGLLDALKASSSIKYFVKY